MTICDPGTHQWKPTGDRGTYIEWQRRTVDGIYLSCERCQRTAFKREYPLSHPFWPKSPTFLIPRPEDMEQINA